MTPTKISLKDIFEINRIYFHFKSELDINNTPRKNLFLATCFFISPDIDIQKVSAECPYGGIIGIGDSRLESILGSYRLFQLHAAFHDACGYMKTRFDLGPGYVYAFSSCQINSCLLGHITGLLLCARIKLLENHFYQSLLR